MNIMMEFTYPAPQAEDVGKAFIDALQANPMPDYVKIVEIYQLWGGEGIKGFAYYELEKGKESEGMNYLGAHELGMCKAIDGYRVQSNVVFSLAESYAMVGMEGPTV